MFFQGSLDNLILVLEKCKSSVFAKENYSFHINLEIYRDNYPLIALSKKDLTPLDFFPQSLDKNTVESIVLVDKFTYDLLNASVYERQSPDSPSSETDFPKIKTEEIKAKTEEIKIETEKPTAPQKKQRRVVTHPKTVVSEIVHPAQFISGNPTCTDGLIENHDYDCTKVNKPAVFAIKRLSENYFLLFYRKSVYDSGTDVAFRKYLNNQPGSLVVYKYIHSIDNLRNELIGLGLKLRHNGKNELSHYQVEKLLNTFGSLDFL